MSNSDQAREQTAKGPLGKAIGKAKEAVGSAVGNEDLAREGQIQKLAAETEEEATAQAQQATTANEEARVSTERTETEERRRQLETELADSAQLDAIEGKADSKLAASAQRAREASLVAETERRAEDAVTSAQERSAAANEASELSEAEKLRRGAEQARATADAIDPKETD